MATMKASVRHKYGSPDVLGVEEIERPDPGDDEVLVRTHAASANLGDWELLRGDPLFIALFAKLLGPKPRVDPSPSTWADWLAPKYKILGCDFAGEVAAIGKNVSRFAPGDEVFGMCALGAFAEYVCVPENGPYVRKPASLSYEQAAALPQAAFIALQGIRDRGQVQAGQHVLINGAGGGAGTLAVQIAKLLGAEVTAVDNTKKQGLMRSIGADHVIDYTQKAFTDNGARYDLILDLVAQRSIFECKRVLKPKGKYIVAGGATAPTLLTMLFSPLFSLDDQTVSFLMAADNTDDLEHIAELVESGKIVPVIDKHYPLSEVPDALRYMGEGRALGKVIITM